LLGDGDKGAYIWPVYTTGVAILAALRD